MRAHFIICLGVVLALATGCKPTKTEVVGMFQKAGGMEAVSQESAQLFQRFGTNDSRVIYGSELTNYPRLSSIGRPLFLQMSTSNSSAHIEVPIGSHWGKRFIFIFDPDRPFRFQYQAECSEIASNIYLGP